MSKEPSHGASFNENDYARPNESWSCGWAADGHACPLGPAKKGVCRSAYECAPYQEDDTWFCARMKANGGKCDDGPLPDGICCRPIQKCQPVRNIMSRRGVVSLCVFAAAIGIALIMVAAPGRSRMISPGPLISAHRQAVDRCEDCHVAGDGQLSDWVHAAFDSETGRRQSTLCLKCHDELGENALHPHSQSSDALEALAKQLGEPSSDRHALRVVAAKHTFGSPTDAHAELSCATCHREHHGTADLTALTNQQCQVCHATDFHSFGNGHPELTKYPYDRRTRIYFDHQTHFGVHFPASGGKTHQCRDCHTPDAAGRYMLAKRFEATCAQCHDRQIEDVAMPGLLVAAIPAVDVESLQAGGVEIGQWPSIYPNHVEARAGLAPFFALISPHRRVLWSAKRRLEGIDLADLSEATPQQLRDVETLVWTFKESLVDLLAKGRSGLQAEFGSGLKRNFSQEQIEELVAAVPLEGLATMQRQWLPSVVEEVAARRAGTALPAIEAGEADLAVALHTADVVAADLRASRLLNSGWYLHSPSLSLRYRPTRHADPVMKMLIDRSVFTRSWEVKLKTSGRALHPVEEPLGELYDALASPFASGRCRKCHTFESPTWDGVSINWLSYRPPLAQHSFTHFNHAPHLTRQTNDACSDCHVFDQNDKTDSPILRPEFVANEVARTAIDFTSDFAHMSKTNCAQCHTRQSARDRCTTCHNYHVR